ncbi:YdiU family protein [Gallaecimonas kandeliae]|uniref:protein adenylyltransferase SelO n=1 Tax=Gallaecimonas kandeliae TaxID=3029055 RepID=UPI002647AD96|nr:YdiU family protein [Gallaecimonas kandeliae]WKE65439.1 YdiU family protein [Gallaecimonas kandeliae]
MALEFDNRYARDFPSLYSAQEPMGFAEPQLVVANDALVAELGLAEEQERLADWFGGRLPLPGAQPLAQKYTGHQFGVYNPMLGDGRGLLLGEVKDGQGGFWDLHLKGAGPTPYARGGDGRAVLRSCIREFLASEALHHLGIPTTRALCVVAGELPVQREHVERGAMLTRVARTHIRFGHFEHCFHRGLGEELKGLMDYVIERHWPDLQGQPAKVFFERVVHKTARMVALWQAYGFAHGVMNTDNFSILGDTFDFGPYGFLDDYQPGFVCNHSDHSGRYAFDAQPSIALWNLNCLAMALSPLIASDDLVAALKQFQPALAGHYLKTMGRRLGLCEVSGQDAPLINELLALLADEAQDYNLAFRWLGEARQDDKLIPCRDHYVDRARFDAWAERYLARLRLQDVGDQGRQLAMNDANPLYVLRNYLAQNAIAAAEQGDFSEVRRLYGLLQNPFTDQPGMAAYAQKAPDWGKRLEVSCSS